MSMMKKKKRKKKLRIEKMNRTKDTKKIPYLNL